MSLCDEALSEPKFTMSDKKRQPLYFFDPPPNVAIHQHLYKMNWHYILVYKTITILQNILTKYMSTTTPCKHISQCCAQSGEIPVCTWDHTCVLPFIVNDWFPVDWEPPGWSGSNTSVANGFPLFFTAGFVYLSIHENDEGRPLDFSNTVNRTVILVSIPHHL